MSELDEPRPGLGCSCYYLRVADILEPGLNVERNVMGGRMHRELSKGLKFQSFSPSYSSECGFLVGLMRSQIFSDEAHRIATAVHRLTTRTLQRA
jgi:hypothetical protein